MTDAKRHHFSPALLAEVSTYVGERLGLSFPENRWGDLARILSTLAKETGEGAEELWQRLRAAPDDSLMETLAPRLTIGETYFFRDQACFDALEQQVFPELWERRRQDKRLKIWSAGSSTGEEAYTLAILLFRLLPLRRDWEIIILATDVNRRALAQAALGVFGEWSFRQMPPKRREQYFEPLGGGRWRLRESIRKMVTFAPLNLAEGRYPSPQNGTAEVDVIFCRHTLMYLKPEVITSCMDRLHQALLPGGWLILSPAEGFLAPMDKFTPVTFPGTIFYRKKTRETMAPEEFSGLVPLAPRPAPDNLTRPGFEASVSRPSLPTWEERKESRPGTETAAVFSDRAASEDGQPKEDGPPEKPVFGEQLAAEAKRLADEGRHAEALVLCRQAIEGDRLNAGYYCLMANILEENSQEEEARSFLQRAIYLDPELVVAHFALGNLCRRRGLVREGKRHLTNAWRLLRNYPDENIIVGTDGLTAAEMKEIITHLLARGPK
jgi:chemotaxis protein methyltransferase CheR